MIFGSQYPDRSFVESDKLRVRKKLVPRQAVKGPQSIMEVNQVV